MQRWSSGERKEKDTVSMSVLHAYKSCPDSRHYSARIWRETRDLRSVASIVDEKQSAEAGHPVKRNGHPTQSLIAFALDRLLGTDKLVRLYRELQRIRMIPERQRHRLE
jgi:hypothetical protein